LAPSARLELLSFLKRIEWLLKAGRKVVVDFSLLDYVSADGMIVLFANLENLRGQYLSNLTAIAPRKPLIREVFCLLGINQTMGMSFSVPLRDPTVVHWICASGVAGEKKDFDVNAKKLCSELRNILNRGEYTAESRQALIKGVTEAILNARNHAYKNPNLVTHSKKWWAFAQVKDGRFSAVVYDLGEGIPETARSSSTPHVRERIRGVLMSAAGVIGSIDDKLLLAVMREQRSQTGLDNRGFGMFDVKKFIETKEDAVLSVYSLRALYDYSGATEDAELLPEQAKLQGSLVFWSAPIENKNEEEEAA